MRGVGTLVWTFAFVSALSAACVGSDPDLASPPADAGTTPIDGGGGTGSDSGGATQTDGGGQSDAGPLSPVVGHVFDQYGRPVADATVRINATTAATDASGAFTIDGIAPTYTIDVVAPSQQKGKAVTSFRGLTTHAPELSVEGVYDLRNATVSGTINSSVALGTNEHLQFFTVDDSTGYDQEVANTLDETSDWGGTATWLGAEKSTAVFFIVHSTLPEGTNGRPSSFSQLSTSFRELTPAGATGITGPVDAVSTGTIHGNVSNYIPPATAASVSVSTRGANQKYGHEFPGLLGVTGDFTIQAPLRAGLAVNLIARAGGNFDGTTETGESNVVWKANVDANATGVALAFGHAARGATPGKSAVVSGGTAFTWTAGDPAGVYELEIRCTTLTGEYVSTVYTTELSAVPTDAAPLGMAWPTGADCSWRVTVFHTAKTVDAVVMDATARRALDHPNGAQDGAYAVYNAYAFKTP